MGRKIQLDVKAMLELANSDQVFSILEGFDDYLMAADKVDPELEQQITEAYIRIRELLPEDQYLATLFEYEKAIGCREMNNLAAGFVLGLVVATTPSLMSLLSLADAVNAFRPAKIERETGDVVERETPEVYSGEFSPIGTLPGAPPDRLMELAKLLRGATQEELDQLTREAHARKMLNQAEELRAFFYQQGFYPDWEREIKLMCDNKWQKRLKDGIRADVLNLRACDIWPVMELFDVLTFHSPRRLRQLEGAKKRRGKRKAAQGTSKKGDQTK